MRDSTGFAETFRLARQRGRATLLFVVAKESRSLGVTSPLFLLLTLTLRQAA